VGKRRWIRRVAIVLVVLVVALFVAAELFVAPFVRNTLSDALDNRYGLTLEADGVSVALLRGTATLTGVRVKEGDHVVLEAEEARGSIAVRDVLDARYDFRQLVLVRPVLHVHVEGEHGSNLRRILRKKPKRPPREGPPDIVVLRDLRIEQGRVEWKDAFTDPRQPLDLLVDEIEIAFTEFQAGGTPITGCWGDVRAEGMLRQPEIPARLSIVAWTAQQGKEPTLVAHAALTGLDLRIFPQYVSATDRIALGSDYMHLTATFDVRDGTIALGAIAGEVAGTRTVLPLLVGGTTDDPVFDEDSRLATLMRVPLGRVGRVGEVAVGATWSVLKGGAGGAAEVGGGVVDAGKSLAGGAGGAYEGVTQGDPLGVLRAVGGGLFGSVKALGSGIFEGMKSIVGGGSSAAQSLAGVAPEDLDEQFAAFHLERRRRMLEAALASVPKDVESRRARVAAELAELPEAAPEPSRRVLKR
jgi:hypothetical protein